MKKPVIRLEKELDVANRARAFSLAANRSFMAAMGVARFCEDLFKKDKKGNSNPVFLVEVMMNGGGAQRERDFVASFMMQMHFCIETLLKSAVVFLHETYGEYEYDRQGRLVIDSYVKTHNSSELIENIERELGGRLGIEHDIIDYIEGHAFSGRYFMDNDGGLYQYILPRKIQELVEREGISFGDGLFFNIVKKEILLALRSIIIKLMTIPAKTGLVSQDADVQSLIDELYFFHKKMEKIGDPTGGKWKPSNRLGFIVESLDRLDVNMHLIQQWSPYSETYRDWIKLLNICEKNRTGKGVFALIS